LAFQPRPKGETMPAPVITTRGGVAGGWGAGNSMFAISGG